MSLMPDDPAMQCDALWKDFTMSMLGLVFTMMTVLVPAAHAAEPPYPVKLVKMIVPYPPGGGTDLVGRLVTDRLSIVLKQPFIIENRGGAGSVIGTELVARSAPDGHTLLFSTSAGLVINPLLRKLSYDPLKDFQSVSRLVTMPMLVVASPAAKIATIKELIEAAKREPGKLNYASAGIGAPNHIATEFFKYLTGTDMVHVPFKGFALGITEVLSGQVQIFFNPVTALVPHVRAGKVVALGITSQRRMTMFPDIPTVAESGVSGYEYDLWYAVSVPAKTPMSIVTRLSTEIRRILADPEVVQTLVKQGAEPAGTTPEELDRLIRSEFERLGKVIKAAGIKAE